MIKHKAAQSSTIQIKLQQFHYCSLPQTFTTHSSESLNFVMPHSPCFMILQNSDWTQWNVSDKQHHLLYVENRLFGEEVTFTN